jgi:hypothetical protein
VLLDRLAQRWVALTGRAVDAAAQPWLAGPAGGPRAIGFDFVSAHARAEGLVAHERDEWGRPAGLLPRFVDLSGPRFDAGAVHPAVAAFYERTSAFRLELWSRWSPPFRPLGLLLARLFTGRLAQLEMPLDPLETAGGVESRVIRLVEPTSGALRSVFWARRLTRVGTQPASPAKSLRGGPGILPGSQTAGRVLFVGAYNTCVVPGHDGPCVRTVFPLPGGSATVVLRPRNVEGGGLLLDSAGARFGDPGFYFVHRDGRGRCFARHLRAFRERIHVYPRSGEGAGDVGADHDFVLWGATFLRLRYRISAPGLAVCRG